ncbi:pirin family protein, partial [Acinetobacter pittii]|nr:pirin family protein [Acinetobacter pittii]
SKRVNYVHVISGEVRIGEYEVKAGDALVFEDNAVIHANEDSQFIWFYLP